MERSVIFEKFFSRLAGKFISKRAGLEENMDTKSWWKSKGIWTGIVTGLLGIYATLQPQFGWPTIPEWIFALLGGIGVYSRVDAETKIG